ncbi:adenylyl cyclase-associated protein 1-like [Brachionichthys hirsutus]|uniref:adenylyl cyclase-associated protein 1-like n=1 Tax=Brachionichthys hirsutus TaxID=412623 RepID=UPI003604A406
MAQLESLVQRLEVAVGRLETMPCPAGAAGDSAGGAVSAHVEAFDEIAKGPVAQYLTLSRKIGGDVQKHAEMMKQVFDCQRKILVTASTCQKPSEAVWKRILQPMSNGFTQVQQFHEKNRTSPLFNHLSAVNESVPALGWVAVAPKPGPYVKDMQDSAKFYTNRVLKEYKDKDKTHVEWVKAYIAIWDDLQLYIKKHHTTGLSWNKTGSVASAPAPSAPVGGCPPPPPPGPPPPPLDMSGPCDSSGSSAAEDHSALFASINQGSNITSALKHVSDDQKTHKNPKLRTQNAPVISGPKPFVSAPRPAAPTASACSKPPVFELEGKKWRVENQNNMPNLVIDNPELKQVAYVFKCCNSVLKVNGKINSITLDSCKKVGLVFDDVVSLVDVINSTDVKIQVTGKVPTISINKTDGCQVYLSKDSLDCELVTAKSSAMNVLVLQGEDFKEHPIPEQFKTTWDGSKLVTTVIEMAG